MEPLMLTSFMDELTKISEASSAASATGGNAGAPPTAKSGMGSNSVVASASKSSAGISIPKPSSNPMAKNMSAKPTNYSIVNSSTPSAAFGVPSSKMIPAPQVRT